MANVRRIEVAGDADVSAVRAVARAAMAGQPDDRVYAAELVASELVTNALLHGGGVVGVTLTALEDGIRIDVSDRNRHAPLVAVASADAMTGRGLSLVGRLATRWGVEPTDTGKTVWAEVRAAAPPKVDATAEEILAAWHDPFDEDAPVVPVALGEVPTALLVAAKRHVDNLVREFRLAAGGDQSGTTAPVPSPLAELIDRVVHRFESARLAIKRQATEAARVGAPHTVLELDLPITNVQAAEEYLAALDEVDAYSRANRLLTLETPPQHRVFRHWYIGEIVKQLRAAEAGVEAPPLVPFEERLLAEVDAAEGARRTADRAARLYAVAVALAVATTAEEVASAVLVEGVAALGASGGGVLLADDSDRLTVPGTVGYDATTVDKLRQESRHAELPAAYALRTGEAVWLETVEEATRRFPSLAALEPDTVALCAVPLVTAGTTLGAMRFSFDVRRLFDDDEQRFVLALAAEASESLQRAQLLDRERENRRRLEHERASLEKLASVGGAMLRGRDLDEILRVATDAATQITGAQFGAFFYNALDPDGEGYQLAAAAGVGGPSFEPLTTARNAVIFAPTFSGAGIVRLDDLAADPRFADLAVRGYLAVPVTLSSGEVVGGLFFGHRDAAVFGETAERLAAGVAGQTAAAIENVRSMEERVRVAAILQQSLLPAGLPDVEGAELGAVYAASGEGVGGDFYDVFPLGEHRWGISMGDVRGRGPEAAALTALARYTIRTAAMLDCEPREVLRVLNEAIHSAEDDERFCSAVYGVLEIGPAGATLVYASAGHPPAVLVRSSGLELADPTGGLVGIAATATYTERTYELAPGESIVLYTDGISEARRDGLEFGEGPMLETLDRLRLGRLSAQDLADQLMAASQRFGAGATDDSAVFVFSIR